MQGGIRATMRKNNMLSVSYQFSLFFILQPSMDTKPRKSDISNLQWMLSHTQNPLSKITATKNVNNRGEIKKKGKKSRGSEAPTQR